MLGNGMQKGSGEVALACILTGAARARRTRMAAPSAAEAFAAGSSARAAGDLEASVLHYDAALRLNPALAEAHINRAAVLADLGNRGDEAVHAYVAGLSAKRWPRSTASYHTSNSGS